MGSGRLAVIAKGGARKMLPNVLIVAVTIGAAVGTPRRVGLTHQYSFKSVHNPNQPSWLQTQQNTWTPPSQRDIWTPPGQQNIWTAPTQQNIWTPPAQQDIWAPRRNTWTPPSTTSHPRNIWTPPRTTPPPPPPPQNVWNSSPNTPSPPPARPARLLPFVKLFPESFAETSPETPKVIMTPKPEVTTTFKPRTTTTPKPRVTTTIKPRVTTTPKPEVTTPEPKPTTSQPSHVPVMIPVPEDFPASSIVISSNQLSEINVADISSVIGKMITSAKGKNNLLADNSHKKEKTHKKSEVATEAPVIASTSTTETSIPIDEATIQTLSEQDDTFVLSDTAETTPIAEEVTEMPITVQNMITETEPPTVQQTYQDHHRRFMDEWLKLAAINLNKPEIVDSFKNVYQNYVAETSQPTPQPLEVDIITPRKDIHTNIADVTTNGNKYLSLKAETLPEVDVLPESVVEESISLIESEPQQLMAEQVAPEILEDVSTNEQLVRSEISTTEIENPQKQPETPTMEMEPPVAEELPVSMVEELPVSMVEELPVSMVEEMPVSMAEELPAAKADIVQEEVVPAPTPLVSTEPIFLKAVPILTPTGSVSGYRYVLSHTV